MVLENLQPQKVFYYFEKISMIPHGSGNTKAISDYVVSVAKEHNLKYYQDDFNNVIIYKDGVGIGADKEPVILQGHLDMVCEKNFETDAKFDFTKDPLNLKIMDDYVYAKGTTLGGDDGIAVAYMLAILTDDLLVAPPLECVFTVDEEIGMLGAKELDVSKLSGKRLVNIDQEEEGIILTSCAGGMNVNCEVPVNYTEEKGIKYNIVICGLIGGHSGTEINKYRANANLIMGRLLYFVNKEVDFKLVNINGGLQDNAIPRECRCELIIDQKDVEVIDRLVSDFEDIIHNEFSAVEKNICIYGECEDEISSKVLTKESKDKVIFILMTVPDGVEKMSADADNLVKTSSNAGIIRLNKDIFEVIISLRSSLESEKYALSDRIQSLTEIIGGKYKVVGEYPAWEYKEDSPLRESVFSAYQMLYGRNPKIAGIHAGLETGLFYKKIKDIDMVSIGPNIEDIHTPKERMSISSVARVFGLLLQMLDNMANGL